MIIKYPVRVSITDETLIVDQDNASIATTFFGKEDYDAEYERRALDAAVIVECLNKRKALTSRIEALEEENEELHDSLEAAFLGTPGWRDKTRSALAKKEG